MFIKGLGLSQIFRCPVLWYTLYMRKVKGKQSSCFFLSNFVIEDLFPTISPASSA